MVNSVNNTDLNNKLKDNNVSKNKETESMHYSGITREWNNSIYSYNKNYIKLLIYKNVLVKYLLDSYLNMNFFISKYNKIKIKRKRINSKRFSIKKIFSSNVEIKHTNNNVIITLFIFNKKNSVILKILKKLEYLKWKKKDIFKNKKIVDKYKGFLKTLKNKLSWLKSRISKKLPFFPLPLIKYQSNRRKILGKKRKYINNNPILSNEMLKNIIKRTSKYSNKNIKKVLQNSAKNLLLNNKQSMFSLKNDIKSLPNKYNIKTIPKEKDKKILSYKLKETLKEIASINRLKSKGIIILNRKKKSINKLPYTKPFKSKFIKFFKPFMIFPDIKKRKKIFRKLKLDIKKTKYNALKKISLSVLRKNRLFNIIKLYNIIKLMLYGKNYNNNILHKITLNLIEPEYKKWTNLKLKHPKIYISKIIKKLINKRKIFLKNLVTSLYYNQMFLFNKFKFTYLFLNFKGFGLINIIKKIYKKKIEFNIISLKSIYLNSDMLSESIAIKLTNRKNKLLRILTKALRKVKLPIFYSYLLDKPNNFNSKNLILNSIRYKAISGIRFEASGRLTKRLIASRSMFKVRYIGNIKNIYSSYKYISSPILRGYIKSSLQYTLINSKTRNGSFGLKGWVNSY